MNFPQQLELPKRILKNAFLAGHKLTTAQANHLGSTVDARKCISRLRSEGLPIADEWESERGRRWKVYFYKPEIDEKEF